MMNRRAKERGWARRVATMPGADFRAPVAYATDTLDAWEASSAANSRQVDQAALSDDNVSALWRAATLHTHDVGEQAWLVAHCVMAGKSPEWLAARVAEGTRLPGRPIGEPETMGESA